MHSKIIENRETLFSEIIIDFWEAVVDASRVKPAFLIASDLSDPAKRAAYLEGQCGDDDEIAKARPGSAPSHWCVPSMRAATGVSHRRTASGSHGRHPKQRSAASVWPEPACPSRIWDAASRSIIERGVQRVNLKLRAA